MSATDYSFAHSLAGGCAPCGSPATNANTLPSLSLDRNTYLSVTEVYPSFGDRSGFAKYDDVIVLAKNKSTIEFRSPGEQTIQTSQMEYNPATTSWERLTPIGENFAGVTLYKADGIPITNPAQRNQAHTAILLDHNGSTRHFEVFWSTTGVGVARLVSLMDRYGNEEIISYLKPHVTTKVTSMNTQFRKKSITDAYGRKVTFTTKKQAGNFVISSATLPSGQKITYSYANFGVLGNPLIKRVNHPDGSKSFWGVSTDPATKYKKLFVHEPHAASSQRRKTITLQGKYGFDNDGNVESIRPRLTRIVKNGAGETVYANRKPAGQNLRYVYEGGTKVRAIAISGSTDGTTQNSYVSTPISAAAFSTTSTSTWALELTRDQVNTSRRKPALQTDALGRGKAYSRHPFTQSVLAGAQKDGYTSQNTFNTYNQSLLTTDTLGRQALNTYDAFGSLIARTTALGTADETTSTYIYNNRGQIVENRDALYDSNSPELHNTKFVYDATGYLIEKIESADTAGGTRPKTTFSYDALGRVTTTTDPLGRITTFEYDFYNRRTKTTYNDTSYEQVTYGAAGSGKENLVVIETKIAAGTPEESLETCTYLVGTNKKQTCTINGETRTTLFDYRNRVIGTSVQADSQTALATNTEYDQLSRRRSTTDAYGRKTYYLYDQNDRVTKTIRETIPGALTAPAITAGASQTSAPETYTLTDKDGNDLDTINTHKVTYTCDRDLFLEALTRDLTPNASYLITESIYDSEGQRLITTDARGNNTWTQYDELGRTTLTIAAVGTPSEIRSEQDYDDNSNLVESRSPRHFTEGAGTTANLVGVGTDTYTYNGRNLRASHNTAVGSTQEQFQSWTYYLDGRADQHTDYRGNIAKQIWHLCCGRLQASIQRDGTSTTINNTDYKGQTTHTAVVSSPPASGDYHNPANADTLRETTTRFDGRGRPTHTTLWLTPLDSVDDDARLSLGDASGIPIAGLDGIPSTDGLTTSYQYDEDLTDGTGIDADYASQLTELTARYGYNPFDNNTGINGYAVAVTNPAGETTVQISDGAGRTILTINPEGDLATMEYDALTASGDLQSPSSDITIPDPLLTTTTTDANGNSTSTYTDGAGRTIASVDAEGNLSAAAYNANSSLVISRDANDNGQDCSYDALNRDTTCADLQEQAEGNSRTKTYNAASQILTTTNADQETTTNIYDVRSRLQSTTDANNITTSYLYDANNNLITLTDGNNNQRHWFFDERNLNTTPSEESTSK